MRLKWQMVISSETGDVLPTILREDGTILEIAEQTYRTLTEASHWVAKTLPKIDPHGPALMTRERVCNRRVVGSPMFWEITTYDSEGKRLMKTQWNSFMQDRTLSSLVERCHGFPLEAAKEIGS